MNTNKKPMFAGALVAGCLWSAAIPAGAEIVSSIPQAVTKSDPTSDDGKSQYRFDTTTGVVQLDADGNGISFDFVDTDKGSGDWILNGAFKGAWQSFGGELLQYIPGFPPAGGILRANLLFVEDAKATTGTQSVVFDVYLHDKSGADPSFGELGMRFELFAWNEGDTAPVLSASGPSATSYNPWDQGGAVLLMDKTVGVTGSTIPADIEIANDSYTSVTFGGIETGTGYDYYAWRIGALGYNTVNGNDNFRLTSPTATFVTWQDLNGGAGVTGGIDGDHDDDGVMNGVEFFLGGPNDTTGFTALPGVVDTDGTLSITWTKHPDYPGEYGNHYVVQTSDTLSGSWTPETLLGGTITTSGNDVTYTFPAPLDVRNFARLKVSGP